MTLSSLLGRPAAAVVAPAYPETREWLQEQAGISGSAIEHHKSDAEELLICLAELHVADADALAFCGVYVGKVRFWLEWHVYAESGTPDFHHKQRRAFISNLRAGRPTIMMNIVRAHA